LTSGLGCLEHLPYFLASLATAILTVNQHGDVRGSWSYFTDMASSGDWLYEQHNILLVLISPQHGSTMLLRKFRNHLQVPATHHPKDVT